MRTAIVKHSKIVLCLVTACLFSVSVQAQFGGFLKDDKLKKGANLIKTATASQSLEEEIEAGNAVAAMYLGSSPMIQDEKILHYVNDVGRRIARQSGRPDLPWVFGVLDTESVNAFAAPGGKILLTMGLYKLLDSEDELAAVLGHEIAHVDRQHHWNIIKKQKLALGVTDALTSSVDTGNGLGQAAFEKMEGILKDLLTSGLDRDGEYEADLDGVYLAAKAGYDSTGMLGVLEKLSETTKAGSDTSFLFKTHPSAEDRINYLLDNFNKKLEKTAKPSDYEKRIAKYAVE